MKPEGGERVLSWRELNRTTLARQLLLQRAALSPVQAIERLVGMQAQLARGPFVGLWTRLSDFSRDDLAREIEHKRIIKATAMRGTLHLLSADDYVQFRATLQPVLSAALEGILKQRGSTVDVPRLVAAVRDFMAQTPRSFAEITTLLSGLVPDGDAGAMRYAVRMHLPMVQVPVQKGWSYPGNPRFTPADAWLATALPETQRSPDLIRRYLAGFGPATVKDVQTWSYLSDLEPVFATLRDELVTYRDERGRQLFDLPELPIEASDAAAPVRFLPEFDNALLAHQDRARVVPDVQRAKVYLPGLRVAATVLIDGFVGGVWTTDTVRRVATLRITPLVSLDERTRAELLAEGERLLRFAEPDARTFEVLIA